MEAVMKVEQVNGVDMVSTLTVAEELGIQHKNLLETIYKYLPEIENAFGKVAFKTDTDYQAVTGLERNALAYLTEDQSLFIGTLSRNSQQVVQFKARLVQAFQAARKFINKVATPLSDAEMKIQVFKMLEQEAQSLKEQLTLAENTIKEQAPMVVHYNKVLSAENSHLATAIAQVFGLGVVTFNRLLKEWGIQRRVGNDWVLVAKYLNPDKPLTITRPVPYLNTAGVQQTKNELRWTESGREFLVKEFEKHGYKAVA